MRRWNGFKQKKGYPKVSVVIPCHNHGDYLRSALESVLAQNYSNLEILVVDDGSSDHTRQVVAEFPHVNYIRQCHSGCSVARNNGIKRSDGDLIAFLDADDLWLPGKLHAQVKHLMKNPDYGLVYSPIRVLNNSSGVVKWRPKLYARHATLEKLLVSNTISTSTVLVRRSCFEKVGLFDPDLGEFQDWEMWLRIASFFNVGVVRKSLAVYRQYRSPLERNVRAVLGNQLVVIKKIREFTEGREVKVPLSIFDQAVALRYIQMSLNCLEAENLALFETFFLKGVIYAERVPAHMWLRLLTICFRQGGRGLARARSILSQVVGYRVLRAPIVR